MFNTRYTAHAEVLRKYRSIVSGCGWVATCVANVISCAVSILGRCMHNPCLPAFKQCKQLLRCLKGGRNIGPTYVHTGGAVKYYKSSDASFAGLVFGESLSPASHLTVFRSL